MSILYWLLGHKAPPSAPKLETQKESFIIRFQDDQTFHDSEDLLAGLTFVATLQIRTPLYVLEHSGEFHPGPPSAAPKYCSIADGYWKYRLKSFDEIAGPKAWKSKGSAAGGPTKDTFLQRLMDQGISEEEAAKIEPDSSSSDIGYVRASEYLPFLKAFRKIVEKQDIVESKLQRLFALRDAEVRFQQIWARLEAAYPDFPESFFYLQLTAIPGIGAKLAQRLFKAGLRDIATTLSAPDSVLRSVGGVGPRLIQNIRNFVEVEQTE